MSGIWKTIIFALLLAPNLVFVGKALACDGPGCNGKNPIQEQCKPKPKPVADAGNNRVFLTGSGEWLSYYIALRYSNNCRSNWAYTVAPRGTQIYVEERYPEKDPRNRPSGTYTTEVNGQSYGNMSDGTKENRACASFPGISEPLCTDWVK